LVFKTKKIFQVETMEIRFKKYIQDKIDSVALIYELKTLGFDQADDIRKLAIISSKLGYQPSDYEKIMKGNK